MGWMVGGAWLPRLPLLPNGTRFVPALARKEIPTRPARLCAVLLLVLVRRLRGDKIVDFTGCKSLSEQNSFREKMKMTKIYRYIDLPISLLYANDLNILLVSDGQQLPVVLNYYFVFLNRGWLLNGLFHNILERCGIIFLLLVGKKISVDIKEINFSLFLSSVSQRSPEHPTFL